MKIILTVLTVLTVFCLFQVPVQAEDVNEGYIEQYRSQISVALGAGVMTNPVVGKSSIPLVVLPSVKIYGENAFFDNGLFGYTFNPTQDAQFSLVAKPNKEKLFFIESSAFASLIVNQGGLGSDLPSGDLPETEFGSLRKREWAVDMGVQVDWFFEDKYHLSLNYVHDVTGVYNGANALARLNFILKEDADSGLVVSASSGVEWKSAELINYYYGIDEQDDVPSLFDYSTSSSFVPFLAVKFKRNLNSDWKLIGLYKTEFLASEITNSPIIEDSSIQTLFLGLEYAF